VLGSAALEAVQVAAGAAHGSITVNGKLWDIAAAAAIVLEAGGVLTTPQNGPFYPMVLTGYAGAKTPYVVAGKAAHGELIAAMQS
jgi:fructose-1,6-bisphosphatase/inositol monophosphatase family enzyme